MSTDDLAGAVRVTVAGENVLGYTDGPGPSSADDPVTVTLHVKAPDEGLAVFAADQALMALRTAILSLFAQAQEGHFAPTFVARPADGAWLVEVTLDPTVHEALPPPSPLTDYYVFYESTSLWRATVRAVSEEEARTLWQRGVNQGDDEISENPTENIVDVKIKP